MEAPVVWGKILLVTSEVCTHALGAKCEVSACVRVCARVHAGIRATASCDHKAEYRAVAVHGPEPPAGGARGLLQTAASCERVSTFCNRMCDHGQTGRKKRKRFGGWNVMWTVGFNHWTPQGCYRLPPMLLKAKGWFRASGFCCYFTWPCEWPQFPQSAERDRIY